MTFQREKVKNLETVVSCWQVLLSPRLLYSPSLTLQTAQEKSQGEARALGRAGGAEHPLS